MAIVVDGFQALHDDISLPLVPDTNDANDANGFNAVERDPNSWSASLPANQGLYLNENEKDSCGVGFVCHIKGEPSHKIVSDARQLLCAMTHRGATGADSRDGDGAGVMTAIPHKLLKREAETDIGCTLPDPGEYAVGNIFFKANDPVQLQSCQAVFSRIAKDLGLRVLGWREVPTDGTILGPAASSKEPAILQPFVVLSVHYGDGNTSQRGPFDAKHFERQLYVLRKHATHSMFVFFCSYHVFGSKINKPHCFTPILYLFLL
jgi:glutamate synthase (NADH)